MKANDRYHSIRHTRNPVGTASGKQQTQIPPASLADSTAKQWLRRLSAATDIPDQESCSVCAKFEGNTASSASGAGTVGSSDSAMSIPVTPLPELIRKPVGNDPVPITLGATARACNWSLAHQGMPQKALHQSNRYVSNGRQQGVPRAICIV